jgi:hypothetical protein
MRALALAVFLASPAPAAEFALSPVAARSAGAPGIEAIEVEDYLFNPLSVEEMSVMPGVTPLADVRAMLGGEVRTDAAGSMSWLCYDAAGILTWFISVPNESGDDMITAVVQEATVARGVTSGGCTAGGILDLAPGNNIPVLGATEADLAARFGLLQASPEGWVAYRRRVVLGDDGYSWIEVKTVAYLLRGGEVSGVAFAQHSEDGRRGLRLETLSAPRVAALLDLTSFANSTGPRREGNLKTLRDFGFRDLGREGDTIRAFEADRTWMIALTVLEADDERILLCVVDQALNGGSYFTVAAIEVVLGADELLHATGAAVRHPDCLERQ